MLNAVCGVVEAIEEVASAKTAHRLSADVGEEARSQSLPLPLMSAHGLWWPSSAAPLAMLRCQSRHCAMRRCLAGRPVHRPRPALLEDLCPRRLCARRAPKAVKAAATVDKLGNADVAEGVDALFVSKPKLTKEEKEIAKLEKAAAKGDAKAATKLQHLKLRHAIAAKRAAGEEVYTDDELEAAGLSAP